MTAFLPLSRLAHTRLFSGRGGEKRQSPAASGRTCSRLLGDGNAGQVRNGLDRIQERSLRAPRGLWLAALPEASQD